MDPRGYPSLVADGSKGWRGIGIQIGIISLRKTHNIKLSCHTSYSESLMPWPLSCDQCIEKCGQYSSHVPCNSNLEDNMRRNRRYVREWVQSLITTRTEWRVWRCCPSCSIRDVDGSASKTCRIATHHILNWKSLTGHTACFHKKFSFWQYVAGGEYINPVRLRRLQAESRSVCVCVEGFAIDE
jgi:hypothetical protein